MTAVNIIKLDDTVHLFTDTKISGAGLPVGCQVAKCFPIPHLNAAIATRGRKQALDLMVRIASSRATNYADLRRVFGNLRQRAGDTYFTDEDRQVWEQNLDVFIVGLDGGSPDAFAVFNHGDHGMPPWELIDIPYVILLPPVPNELMAEFAGSDQPLTLMSKIMETQSRLHPAVIGGRFQATTVRQDGIFTTILPQIESARDNRNSSDTVIASANL